MKKAICFLLVTVLATAIFAAVQPTHTYAQTVLAQGEVINASRVNVRAYPTEHDVPNPGPSIFRVSRGDIVDILALQNQYIRYWFYISFQGQTGWIYSYFLDAPITSAARGIGGGTDADLAVTQVFVEPAFIPAGQGLVVNASRVNVREYPTDRYNPYNPGPSIFRVSRNQLVTIIGRQDYRRYWYEISVDGRTGWIYNYFIRTP